jgi:hypothetical protein
MGNSKSKPKCNEKELREEINKILHECRDSKVNGAFENLKYDYYKQANAPGSYVYAKKIDHNGKTHNLDNYGDLDTSEFKVNIVRCEQDIDQVLDNNIYDSNNCPSGCTCELHTMHVNLKEKLDAYHHTNHINNNDKNQYGSYMIGGYNYNAANSPTSDYGIQYGGARNNHEFDDDEIDGLTDLESDKDDEIELNEIELNEIDDIDTSELNRIQSKIYNSTESSDSIKHVYNITNRKPVNFRKNILDSSENNIMKMSKGRTNPKYR